jgi:hypothetical protein
MLVNKNAAAQAGRPSDAGTVTLLLGRERFEKLERLRLAENTTLHALIVKALAHYCKTEHDETF